MDLEIFTKIIQNNQNFTLEELEILKKLVKQGIVKFQDDNYILSKKYTIGKISTNSNVTKLITLDNKKQNIIIDKTHLNQAYSNDVVLAQIIFNPRGGLKAKVIKILSKNDIAILCYIINNDIFDMKNHIKLTIKVENKHNLKDYDIFLVKNNTIVQIIGNIADSTIDEKISLYLYKEDYRLKNYSTKIKSIKEYSNRVDLTHLSFCTIDPKSAKDHDDAIYYDEQNHILYVAIADVSSYIHENSILDKEAKKRAFSVYLPHKVLPMLPFELSSDLCSLKPNEKRLAYVMKIYIDINSSSVIKSELFEAVIESKHRYSYEYIDNQIQTNNLDTSLQELYNIILSFRKKRLKNGYDFRTKELRQILDKNQNLIDISEQNSTPSHWLVEECMLLANIQAAKKLDNIGIFRVHEEPSRKSIDQLIKDLTLLGLKVKLKTDIHKTIESIQQKAKNVNLEHEVDRLIIQAQQQARYSSEIAMHFGLGFSHYSHFTSPIRRYSDLVLHRILKTKQIPKDIDEICEIISIKEREITKLVWDFEARKYARWAADHIGETYKAKIVDIDDKPKGELLSGMLGMKFEINNYAGETLFSDIDIKIISSDIVKKIIICEISS